MAATMQTKAREKNAPARNGRAPVLSARPLTGLAPASAVALAAALGAALTGCDGGPNGRGADASAHWQLIDSYCLECHNSADATAGLVLEGRLPEQVPEHAELWETVVRKLRSHMMPPPGGPRPDNEAVDAMVGWLERTLDAAATAPDPGHVVLHRLNRTEYANAVHDLVALDIDPAALLPVDGSEAGFDNVANALQVSPTFIDQYLSAARNLSKRAIGNRAARPVGTPYTFPDTGQEFHVPGLPLGTRGGAVVEHDFPGDGEYLLNIGDLVTGLWGFNQEHRNTLIATIDGEKFFELEIGGGEDLKALDQIGAPAVDRINAQLKNIPFTTTAGVHRVGVTFLHRSLAESDRKLRSLVPGRGQDAVLKINQFEIFGPVTRTGLSATPSRDAVFVCYPDSSAEEQRCAAQIIETLTAKAFRGLGTDREIGQLTRLYELGTQHGGFEAGIEYALAGILAHPKFLYRVEEPPADVAADQTYALDSTALASRLSFFLWSTIPDQTMLDIAAADGLADPAVLNAQVQRLLADPRSATLASNFVFQWLALGELEAVDPDPEIFRDVHRDIREYFVKEIELFADSIFREDRSILDLLTANYTFLNEPLALHYGINGIRGTRFRRVELEEPRRFGLLGKGGVLMTASYPNRTSPVLRGAWLLKNLLGTPPPDPPPNVEALVENVAGQPAATVRERLESHRSNPSCNGCHGIIDPLGFALESFDAVGRLRARDRLTGTPIDASGILADGRSVDGPAALRQALVDRPEQFIQAFVEKLMTYAIGRALNYRDMPTIRQIVRDSAREDYRFSAIVRGVVHSPQFRQQRLVLAESQ